VKEDTEKTTDQKTDSEDVTEKEPASDKKKKKVTPKPKV
jgi:hypothetical protein